MMTNQKKGELSDILKQHYPHANAKRALKKISPQNRNKLIALIKTGILGENCKVASTNFSAKFIVADLPTAFIIKKKLIFSDPRSKLIVQLITNAHILIRMQNELKENISNADVCNKWWFDNILNPRKKEVIDKNSKIIKVYGTIIYPSPNNWEYATTRKVFDFWRHLDRSLEPAEPEAKNRYLTITQLASTLREIAPDSGAILHKMGLAMHLNPNSAADTSAPRKPSNTTNI